MDLENVLIVMVAGAAEAERAVDTLRALGFTDERLRVYTSEQILAYDEAFRSNRGLLGRAIGTLVDNTDAMAQYVEYAREGRSALWVHVQDRDDANRVIRHLSDHVLLHVWFHGPKGLETFHVRW